MQSNRSKGAVFAHTLFISATVDIYCRFLYSRPFFAGILSVITSIISLQSGNGYSGFAGSNLNDMINQLAEFKTKTL